MMTSAPIFVSRMRLSSLLSNLHRPTLRIFSVNSHLQGLHMHGNIFARRQHSPRTDETMYYCVLSGLKQNPTNTSHEKIELSLFKLSLYGSLLIHLKLYT